MAHDAEYDCAQGDQHRLLGDGQQPGPGLGGGQFRWVCGAVPHPAEPVPAPRLGTGPDTTPSEAVERGARVPRQRDGEPAEEPVADDVGDPPLGCRTERPGWAGAHRHGAVRPRSRRYRRERPPHRWC